jgi:hypothetical protein
MHVNILGCADLRHGLGLLGRRPARPSPRSRCPSSSAAATTKRPASARSPPPARSASCCRPHHHGGLRGGGRSLDHQGVPRRLHPGFILTALFSGYIIVWALANPAKTPREDARLTFAQKLAKTRPAVPCLALIAFVVIVMAMSWATATEAAAYGVLGALVIAWWSGGLDRQSFWASLMGATRLSCMIMFILAGASFLSSCMAFTGIPRVLAEWVASLEPHKYTLIAILAGIYILLGTALDGVLDDRAHHLGGHSHGRESRLRPRLVRHLHRAAGRDRRAHPAARASTSSCCRR